MAVLVTGQTAAGGGPLPARRHGRQHLRGAERTPGAAHPRERKKGSNSDHPINYFKHVGLCLYPIAVYQLFTAIGLVK